LVQNKSKNEILKTQTIYFCGYDSDSKEIYFD